jgi:hypothetical protein
MSGHLQHFYAFLSRSTTEENILRTLQLCAANGANFNESHLGPLDCRFPIRGRMQPIHLAIAYKSHRLVHFLLCHGASPESPFRDTVIWAVSHGFDQDALLMVDMLKSTSDLNESVMHWAAGFHRRAVVQKLLEEGYDLNQPDLSGFTPLLCAIQNPDLNAFGFLRISSSWEQILIK